jgi:SAM-dependent methyltransferase
MDLKELQRHWHAFGQQDPLWAILTDSQKRGGKWDLEEFFETGRNEIHNVIRYIESLGLPLLRKKALDFGCGVGRLTQALCRNFDECYGIDIAPSMIKLADEFNRHGARCHYIVNSTDDLKVFADNTFDLIYSVIVLQHMRPEYSKRYIEELMRVLAPNGMLIFQIPSELIPTSQATVLRQPLPESAFKAELNVTAQPSTVTANSSYSVKVRVKNQGNAAWPAWISASGTYPVYLGNHWRNRKGNLIVFDDGRANLPRHLQPSEEVEIELTVKSPPNPGSYILELDMVQELVSWFADKGSATTTTPVQVTGWPNWFRKWGTFSSSTSSVKEFTPELQMYAVPKEEVLALIHANGGRIVDIQDDFSAGPAWLSFRYCAVKNTIPQS